MVLMAVAAVVAVAAYFAPTVESCLRIKKVPSVRQRPFRRQIAARRRREKKVL